MQGRRPSGAGLMTGHPIHDQRNYAFDCCGYIVRPNFLTSAEIETARRELASLTFAPEVWHPAQCRASDLHLSEGSLRALSDKLFHDDLTTQLISYPHRLLESYAIARAHGGLDLHGGSAEFLAGTNARDHSARSHVIASRIYALRLKILIYLDDVCTPEDGRLLYVEGSHKAEFAFHRAFPRGRADAHHLLRTIETRAGDAIWLNEGLLHGAETKTSSTPRRLLAYTFGPSFMASWTDLPRQSLTNAGYASTETEDSRDDQK